MADGKDSASSLPQFFSSHWGRNPARPLERGVSDLWPEKGPTIKNIKNPDRNAQTSRSNFLIFKLENFNLDVSISPQKKGRGGWLARKFHSRSKFSISLEISKFFYLWALWVGPKKDKIGKL